MSNSELANPEHVDIKTMSKLKHVEPRTCHNIEKGYHHVLAKIDPSNIDCLGKAACQLPASTVSGLRLV